MPGMGQRGEVTHNPRGRVRPITQDAVGRTLSPPCCLPPRLAGSTEGCLRDRLGGERCPEMLTSVGHSAVKWAMISSQETHVGKPTIGKPWKRAGRMALRSEHFRVGAPSHWILNLRDVASRAGSTWGGLGGLPVVLSRSAQTAAANSTHRGLETER